MCFITFYDYVQNNMHIKYCIEYIRQADDVSH